MASASFDTDTPGTPGWWIRTLAEQLHNRRVGRSGKRIWTRTQIQSSPVRPGLLLLEDYRRGDPPLQQDIHGGWADPFRRFLRMGRLNIADLLVSAPANRMGIRDFRTAAANDELGDVEARRVMRANNLKLVARDVHQFMLGLGDGYTIITPPDSTRRHSLITAESPLQCITAEDPATGETIAGLKMFRDEVRDADLAYLFLPGEVWVAELPGNTEIRRRGPFRFAREWRWVEDDFEDVPDDQVAMVRFRNRDGVGEFERHINTLDRINDKIFNEWWISKIQAFRQRALELADEADSEGLIGEDPDTDTPIDLTDPAQVMNNPELEGIFTSAPDAMWQLPKGAKIWESKTVDTQGLTKSISDELEHLAAVTSNPLHTITPDAADGSAEGATLMREEHVYKIEDRRDRADGSWARTISLAFRFQADELSGEEATAMRDRADVTQIETLWAPIERYSLQERTTAAASVWGRLPDEAVFADVLQYPPAEVVDRLRQLQQRQRLYANQPPAAGSGQPGQNAS